MDIGLYVRYDVGLVYYEENLWMHRPGRIGILCGSFGFLLLVVIICCVVKHRAKGSLTKDPEKPVPTPIISRHETHPMWELSSKSSVRSTSSSSASSISGDSAYPFATTIATRMTHGRPDATRLAVRGHERPARRPASVESGRTS